jgi:F0F1-type ATP synthase assembly protein I
MDRMGRDEGFLVIGIIFGAIFGLAATVVAMVLPLYVTPPAWVISALLWGGIIIMLCCVASLVLLVIHWKRAPAVRARRSFVGPMLPNDGVSR